MRISSTRRIVLIGLDGMPYRLIKNLSGTDVMPNTRELIREGTFKQMESSVPEVSSVAWSSIITGRNPGEHGIFGFTDIPRGTYRLSFPNFANLKTLPFWYQEGNGKSVILNVPCTYPARDLNGVLVSGFVALNLDRAVYPSSLLPQLKKINYRIEVDSSKAHKSLDLFLKNLQETLQARVSAYRYLWEKEDWQTFMLVFTGTDRLAHFLWEAYEDESHRYHSAFLEYFQQIDKIIGEIKNKMRKKDSLIMLSDHGFELLEYNVNINYFLQQEGFLNLKKTPPRSYADIDPDSKAFALDPARIYIHVQGRYPQGSVSPEKKDELIDRLKITLSSLSLDGRRVVEHIYRKEDLYTGAHLEDAPDLVLLPNTGFNFKASLKAEELFERNVFTGKHTQKDAFLLTFNSSENILPESPCVFDIVNVIDKLRKRNHKQ